MRYRAKSTIERVADTLINQIMFKLSEEGDSEGMKKLANSVQTGFLSLSHNIKKGVEKGMGDP